MSASSTTVSSRTLMDLIAATEYDVEITVHNSSRDKPAIGTTVDVRFIEFGAGAQIKHPIAVLPANVPIWPGTAIVTTKWVTPAAPGHYCIEVELSHPEDANPANNRGWNNTQVHAAASPVDRPNSGIQPLSGRMPAGAGRWWPLAETTSDHLRLGHARPRRRAALPPSFPALGRNRCFVAIAAMAAGYLAHVVDRRRCGIGLCLDAEAAARTAGKKSSQGPRRLPSRRDQARFLRIRRQDR